MRPCWGPTGPPLEGALLRRRSCIIYLLARIQATAGQGWPLAVHRLRHHCLELDRPENPNHRGVPKGKYREIQACPDQRE